MLRELVLVAITLLIAPVGLAVAQGQPRQMSSITDSDGNTYSFERLSLEATYGSFPLMLTRVTSAANGNSRTSTREYDGIFYSPIAGRRAVYAIRSVLPDPVNGPPPTPILSLVAINAVGTGPLRSALPSISLTQNVRLTLLGGDEDLICLVEDTPPVPKAASESGLGQAESQTCSRILIFDGESFSELPPQEIQ